MAETSSLLLRSCRPQAFFLSVLISLENKASDRSRQGYLFYFFWKGFVSSTSNEKEARKADNPELEVHVSLYLFVKYRCKHLFRTCFYFINQKLTFQNLLAMTN